MTRIVTGNDFNLGITLQKNGATFEIHPQSTVKATVVSPDHNTRYIAPVTVDLLTPGTDLSQSLIIVKFTAPETQALLKQGPALLEIELIDPVGTSHPSWFVDVRVVKGQIHNA